jgi:hypothetical protein
LSDAPLSTEPASAELKEGLMKTSTLYSPVVGRNVPPVTVQRLSALAGATKAANATIKETTTTKSFRKKLIDFIENHS